MPSVTRSTKSVRAQRRDDARHRLLEVVERLLEEGESFTEISVERLVSDAGMSRSTFYVYFEDKGDLLRAWYGDINAELGEAASEWWKLGADATRDDVRRALEGIVLSYRPHVTLMAATWDTAAYDASVRELTDSMMSTNQAGLRKHIKAGQKDGFIDPSLPPAQTAAWLTWMAERGLHQMVRGASDSELEAIIDAYAGIVWNTLYAPTRR
jgi:TetR/AcrR family transcriptional regulator, ethionamide resistance regulator